VFLWSLLSFLLDFDLYLHVLITFGVLLPFSPLHLSFALNFTRLPHLHYDMQPSRSLLAIIYHQQECFIRICYIFSCCKTI
jgi:hypothetical protein